MLTQVSLVPAYVLHTRLFRDSSLLVELFTETHGRVSVVARGARSPRSPLKGILQPFSSLLISYRGKSELMTLTHAECEGTRHSLNSATLISGFYLNELLVYLMQHHDPYPNVYHLYKTTLQNLSEQPEQLQKYLRLFEKHLLTELGYALRLTHIANTHAHVKPDAWYSFDAHTGLQLYEEKSSNLPANVFSGASLLALHEEILEDSKVLRDAKYLLRTALNALLNNKAIRSRELL